MPRSLVSRSLEPLVAVLWGVFLLWTAWLAVVWIVPVGSGELGFVAGSPPPPNPELRRAILLLAENADTVWLALAVMNLHRVLTHGYGLRVTRAWLLLSAGGGFALGVLNVKTGVLFGKMQFGAGLGKQLFGVALGWVLLWPALVLGAREAVLRLRPRASHAFAAASTALLVLLTEANLEWPARALRGWWAHPPDAPGVPWMNPVVWFGAAWLMAFAMREKDVAAAAAARSAKPVILLAALNVIAIAARLRQTWFL